MLRNELYKPWFVNKDWGFEIIDGEFSGTVIQIEELDFAKDDSSGLDIKYHVINKPEIVTEDLIKSDLFKTIFETIVNDIVREAVETFKDEQDRNDNLTEPSPQ